MGVLFGSEDQEFQISNHEVECSIPAIVLRDSCKCDECYIEKTQERKHKIQGFSLSIFPTNIAEDTNSISVEWSDNHRSYYTWEDILSIKPFTNNIIEVTPWNNKFAFPTFDYKTIISNNKYLKEVLETFIQYGVTMIENTPIQRGFVEEFANRIAYVREIVFDRVADIVIKKKAYTQGFTPVDLPLHTDCSGYRWPPSVFLFHCLENSVVGGENTYSDGLNASLILKEKHPELFNTLTQEHMGFKLFSDTHDTRSIKPTIELDRSGKVETIRYANWAFSPIKFDRIYITNYWKALKEFGKILDSNMVVTRIPPGCALLVNNQRVLHGRKSFNPSSGHRHFQQVYMEIDDIEARWRCL